MLCIVSMALPDAHLGGGMNLLPLAMTPNRPSSKGISGVYCALVTAIHYPFPLPALGAAGKGNTSQLSQLYIPWGFLRVLNGTNFGKQKLGICPLVFPYPKTKTCAFILNVKD